MKKITKSSDAYEVVHELIKYPEQEEVFIICLNKANGVKDIHFIGLGTDDAAYISNKVIAKYAVLDMASGVILVHTHPSGDPHPSSADIKATGGLKDALKLFDISLLDHLVIGDKCYFSFSDEGVTAVGE